ncbi:MAG: lysoplasmalogenase [Saprospiraceae bacterium]|jgi:uncharacterized membrane protein YhhN|nr:lysoplasmalogenase [Saprospiraceae bacterium]
MPTSRSLQYFLLLSGLHLISLLVWPAAAAYTKPLLLPLLILAVWQAGSFAFRNWLLAALFFSWIGDVVLLFAHKGELYFIGGLIAFLIAHLCYILLFNNTISQHKKTGNYPWWAWLLLLVYIIGLMSLLLPYLQELKIPVLVYGLVIGAMMATAIRGWSYWPAGDARWIVLGAAAFVISDSLLALNKFYMPLPQAPFFIMITYLFAQYGIVRGVTGRGGGTGQDV